jgi:quercetin dioxygenase-like cupin family protein
MSELVVVKSGQGEHSEIAGARWTWKVKSADSAGSFCFFEQLIKPGEGVPLHAHSYPEAFYIVEGELVFSSDDGRSIACSHGDVVIARAETRHTFANASQRDARILSISVGDHQIFFDEVVKADRAAPFANMAPSDAFARVAAIGARTDTRFASPPKSQP